MKYCLVALFDDNSFSFINKIQKNVHKSSRYIKFINPHIPLLKVENPDLDLLSEIVADILKPYKLFKAELLNELTISQNHKFLNINVSNKGYLNRIGRNLNDTLKLHKFNVLDEDLNLDLHLPIGYISFSRKANNLEKITELDVFKYDNKFIKINRIELWKYVSSKKEVTMKTFTLRTF